MSYIFVSFQQSPSNLAVLLIYSEDDGLSLTCPPCFKKAEKNKTTTRKKQQKNRKNRGRSINWLTITITIIYLTTLSSKSTVSARSKYERALNLQLY